MDETETEPQLSMVNGNPWGQPEANYSNQFESANGYDESVANPEPLPVTKVKKKRRTVVRPGRNPSEDTLHTGVS